MTSPAHGDVFFLLFHTKKLYGRLKAGSNFYEVTTMDEKGTLGLPAEFSDFSLCTIEVLAVFELMKGVTAPQVCEMVLSAFGTKHALERISGSIAILKVMGLIEEEASYPGRFSITNKGKGVFELLRTTLVQVIRTEL